MSHLTMESTIVNRLLAVHEPVEIRDTAGNVVGHFVPLSTGPDAETVRKLFDFDKARARLQKQRGQGCSLQEI